MTRLTQLYDLLTEHGGSLSYAAIAGQLGMNQKAVADLITQANRCGMARNVAPMGYASGGTAQLYPDAVRPVDQRGSYQRQLARHAEVLTLLDRHPQGLTQVEVATLLGWGRHTAALCMIQMEQSGMAAVCGGSSGNPKCYTLPDAVTTGPVEAQRQVVSTQSLVGPSEARHEPPTGELGAARKLLAGLQHKSARALACAGNYRYGRAEELFAELQRLGWAS